MANKTGKEKIMDQLQKLQYTAKEAEEMLKDNNEWIERYAGYASEILNIQNTIKNVRDRFYERKPLYVYSNISRTKNAKNLVSFDLRYKGQSVASIEYRKNTLKLVTKKNTGKYYGIEGGKVLDWNSKEAEAFRGYFKKLPCRNDEGKGNEEHRFESALLTELSKNDGNDKALKNIQPVRLIESRFQMRTPFKASKGRPKYAEHNGGCIDLLCRTKHGSKSVINIFELKDEYEDPIKVLHQAVIYSIFIHRLLRTPEAGSNSWWNLFGFNKSPDVTRPLKINTVVAMPRDGKNDKVFANKEIVIEGGILQLHYFYFSLSKTDKVGNIETSLFKG
jgi:hypothetical protein